MNNISARKIFRVSSAALAAIALVIAAAPPAFAAPVLSVQKTASVSSTTAGSPITYTITVQNTGDAAATDVVVTDVLSADLAFQSSSPAASVGLTTGAQTQIQWPLGSLAAGASASMSFTATTPLSLAGTRTVQNAATATSSNTGTAVSATASVTVTQPNPIVIAVKVPNTAQIAAGGGLTYSFTITNTGGSIANDVVITDDIGAKLNYQSASPVPTTVSTIGAVIPMPRLRWVIGSLGAGASFTASINVVADADLMIGNTIFNSVNVDGSNIPSYTSTVSSLVAGIAPGGGFTLTPTTPPALGGVPDDPGTVAGAVTADALPRTGASAMLLLLAFIAIALWQLRPQKTPWLQN